MPLAKAGKDYARPPKETNILENSYVPSISCTVDLCTKLVWFA
jgi:hypothetical protein